MPRQKARIRKSRKKRSSRRRQRGGRIIGEGMQGIAFSPPLECEGGQPNAIKNTGRASPFTKTRKQYVSKIAKANVAETELTSSEELRKRIDPFGRFTAPALATCKASTIQTDPDYLSRTANIQEKGYNSLIFSRYRGRSILNIFDDIESIPLDQIQNILVALANLLVNVSIYVNDQAGILHYDAHPGNIVYDQATKTATLIDFGFARPLDEATKTALQSKQYASVPATLDMTKIHNDSILQFFLFGGSEPTVSLLKNPHLNEWFASAKLLRKNPEASQQDYMDSAQELSKAILVSNIEQATQSPKNSESSL